MIPNPRFVFLTTSAAANASVRVDWNLNTTGVTSAFEPSVALPGGSGALCLPRRCR